MPTIAVNNNPGGRYTRKVFDHLLANHAYGEFGYNDLPAVDPEFLAFIQQAMEKSSTVFIGSASKAAKSTVTTELQRTGIVRTTGLEAFALTDSGRGSAVLIK